MTNFTTENIVLDGTLVSKLRADIEDVFSVARVEVPRQLPQSAAWPLWRSRRNSQEETPERSRGVIFFVGDLLRQNSEGIRSRDRE